MNQKEIGISLFPELSNIIHEIIEGINQWSLQEMKIR